MPRQKPKPRAPKSVRFQSLCEIMVMAIQTGEHRDPGFKEEISDILDAVCWEEIHEIRMVAAYERMLLRRDAEILKLEALREIDRYFTERQERMAREITAVFRRLAEGLPQTPVDWQAPESSPKRIAREAIGSMDDKDRERHHRLENYFSKILANLRL